MRIKPFIRETFISKDSMQINMINNDIVLRQGTTLVDGVEELLIRYIKDNQLKPGDSMPGELALADQLKVGRSVVREALSRLRMLGLVDIRTKRGIIVTEPPLLGGLQRIIHPQLFSEETIRDILRFRVALEIGITDLIFERITNKDIEELEGIMARQRIYKDNILSLESETEFHMKIYEITGNVMIKQLHEILRPIFIYTKENYANAIKRVNRRLAKEGLIVNHKELFDYLKRRDREGYRKAIKYHMAPYNEILTALSHLKNSYIK